VISLLLISQTFSIDVQYMTREERLLFECRAEVRGLEPGEALGTWMACDEKAQQRGLESIRPMIRGYALEAQLMRDYADWKTEDPVAWAKVLLGTSAQREEILPIDSLRTAWLTLLKDHDESVKLETVSSVTVRWQATLDEKLEQDELDEQVRRYLIDAGWRVPEPDTWDAGESAIIVLARPTVEHTAWAGDETLKITRVGIATEELRYKALGTKGEPFGVKGEESDNNRDKARRSAFQKVGQAFADALLMDVVHQLYSNYEVPSPPS